MFPPLNPESGKKIRSRPHLLLKVRDGWVWEKKTDSFVSKDEEGVCLAKALPKRAKIQPRVPQANREATNRHEQELTRYYNVILSEQDDAKELAEVLRGMDFAEKVELPVDPSLPGAAPLSGQSPRK